ncbi:MAG: LysM peptidoglycan-binding domain-containing protein [Anaerolineaceae bacterium]
MLASKIIRYLLVTIISLSFLNDPYHVDAQTEAGYDLVAEVNALRMNHGLEPYTIDPWIMDYAQQHSQYQADTQTSTHLHSDVTNSLAVGLRENVAGGDWGVVTTDIVVNQIWVDWGHMNTMISYETGEVGAGVAVGANDTVYYTLNVRPGGTTRQTTGVANPETIAINPTAPFIPIITHPPAQNGNIIHIVGPGETLWGIAVSYGVTMDEIRSLNEMGNDEITIYDRQELFIRQVKVATTPTRAETTLTSMPTPPTPTSSPSHTATTLPTLTPTQGMFEESVDQPGRSILVLGIGISSLL